jgi:ABC-type glutathione transport system ATPase component
VEDPRVHVSTPNLVQVENLVKVFPIGRDPLIPWRKASYVVALRNVSLSVGRGEILGIVGESGSGKTTLGRCVAGLERPSSGSIRINGSEVQALSPHEFRRMRRHVQMVFQDVKGALDPRMTVRRIIEEPLRLLTKFGEEERRAAVAAVMAEMDLSPSLESRYRHQLSGGQQQRVGLARAVALQPDVIVLDEPVSSLDAAVRGQVLALLRMLHERHGLAYMYISHDLATVRALCRRVAVMFQGRVVEVGTITDIFTAASHPYTKLLLSSMLSTNPSHMSYGHGERTDARRLLLGRHDIERLIHLDGEHYVAAEA